MGAVARQGESRVTRESRVFVAPRAYNWLMETVGIRELKNRLSEYVRQVRGGETIQISSHGEVVAELRVPETKHPEGTPAGLRELLRRGTARRIVRNDPAQYPVYPPALNGATARDLLHWGREDR